MATQGNKCPVCLKLFDDPRWMPCKHIYCFKCIPRLRYRQRTNEEKLVLQCAICAMKYSFSDWSTLKYYATLHCVPYLTALHLRQTLGSTDSSICPSCFTRSSTKFVFEHCAHCKKKICSDCIVTHRDELKKKILQNDRQCHVIVQRHRHQLQHLMEQLENLKLHLDLQSSEHLDRIDDYEESVRNQLEMEKTPENSHASSDYHSLSDAQSQVFDAVGQFSCKNRSIENLTLTTPSSIPMSNLIGEWIAPNGKYTSKLVRSIECSIPPDHLAFDLHSSKLFICNAQGRVSVYDINRVLIDSFHASDAFQPLPGVIKSVTVSIVSVIVAYQSIVQAILQFYSHDGHFQSAISFPNQYISQIRCDNDRLWILELMSASIFSIAPRSHDQKQNEKRQCISFKGTSSFNPFRFAFNHLIIAVLDRNPTGRVRLFNKETGTYLKEITSPPSNILPSDIELTDLLLVYRLPQGMSLVTLEEGQSCQEIDTKGKMTVSISKTNTEILLSSVSQNPSQYLIECYRT